MTGSKPARNQNAEQIARDQIDAKLAETGWIVQHRDTLNFHAGPGIAVREYQTDVGPADHVLFLDRKAIGVIEAKPEEWGHKITVVEDQAAGYAAAKLKWINQTQPLPFVYESTNLLPTSPTSETPNPLPRSLYLPPSRDHGRMAG